MIIPLLQRERSIDDFVDRDEGTRLAALLADHGLEGAWNCADAPPRFW